MCDSVMHREDLLLLSTCVFQMLVAAVRRFRSRRRSPFPPPFAVPAAVRSSRRFAVPAVRAIRRSRSPLLLSSVAPAPVRCSRSLFASPVTVPAGHHRAQPIPLRALPLDLRSQFQHFKIVMPF